MLRPHAGLADLYASSDALQKAHRALLEAGHPELALLVFDAGQKVALAIGKLVVSAANRAMPSEVGS